MAAALMRVCIVSAVGVLVLSIALGVMLRQPDAPTSERRAHVSGWHHGGWGRRSLPACRCECCR